MQYVYLVAAALAPIVLIVNGKRFLGNQTHPAAVFILAWMLCGFLVGLADLGNLSAGGLAFVWVAPCFLIVRFLQKRSAKPSPEL